LKRSSPYSDAYRWLPSVDAVAIAVVGVLVFGFRYMANTGFSNDHFHHLTQAQQVVLGAWPIRDFVDPGWPLTILMSAAAMVTLGHSLFAETVLVSAAFAASAMLTIWLTRRSGVPLVWGLAAVVFQVALMPRSYAYPKLLAYALVCVACWRFLDRPGPARAAVTAAAVVVAFLFRHDHGLVLGAASLIPVLWGGGAARLKLAGVYLLTGTLLILPWAAYVEANQGLASYFGAAVEFSRAEATHNKLVVPTFELGPLPPAGDSTSARDPEANAQATLFYTFIGLPIVWLIAVPFLAPERRVKVAYGAVLALLADATMLRDPMAARLPDVGLPQSLLVAWSLAWGFAWVRQAPAARRLAGPALAALLIVVTMPAVFTVGRTWEQYDRIGGLAWGKLREHVPERTVRLRSDYDDGLMPSDLASAMVPLFQYLRRCTRPDDRLLHIGYDPEVHFYSQRGFAAGHGAWLDQYYTSVYEQERSLAQFRRERVPIATVPSASAGWLDKAFPTIGREVRSRYRHLATIEISDDDAVDVLVDTTLPASGTDAETGWPCFR
jgi:hypothetical protein